MKYFMLNTSDQEVDTITDTTETEIRKFRGNQINIYILI